MYNYDPKKAGLLADPYAARLNQQRRGDMALRSLSSGLTGGVGAMSVGPMPDGSEGFGALIARQPAARSRPLASMPVAGPQPQGAGAGPLSLAALTAAPAVPAPQRRNDPLAMQAEEVEGYKNGGVIQGKGTPTSDSNTIAVSDEEAIIPADVVRAMGGKKWVDGLIAKHHKPVPSPKGMANGGVVRVDEEDPRADQLSRAQNAGLALRTVLNPLGAIGNAASAVGGALSNAATPLVSRIAPAVQDFGAGLMGNAAPPMRTPQPPANSGPPLALMNVEPRLNAVMPNATGGQAQVRAVDNSLAARAAPMFTVEQPVTHATGKGADGFAGRDIIRGGAAPGKPQGAGGTPGQQIVSDYGYGDQITATAGKDGKFNSFSGVGGTGNQAAKPGLADYAAGLARAQSNREQLAAIQAERNAPQMPNDPLAYQQVVNAKTAGRSVSQQNIAAAGAQPYSLAATAAKTDEDQARATNLRAGAESQAANARRTAALAPGEVEAQSISTAIAKLDLGGRQRLNDLGAKIATETDPKKQTTLHSQMLALLGKDKPEEYQVIHAAGGADAMGTKMPDAVVVVNKRTGKAEQVQLGGAQTTMPKADYDAIIKKYGKEFADAQIAAKGLTVK